MPISLILSTMSKKWRCRVRRYRCIFDVINCLRKAAFRAGPLNWYTASSLSHVSHSVMHPLICFNSLAFIDSTMSESAFASSCSHVLAAFTDSATPTWISGFTFVFHILPHIVFHQQCFHEHFLGIVVFFVQGLEPSYLSHIGQCAVVLYWNKNNNVPPSIYSRPITCWVRNGTRKLFICVTVWLCFY